MNERAAYLINRGLVTIAKAIVLAALIYSDFKGEFYEDKARKLLES